MHGTSYEAHCGAFSTPHSYPSWAQIFAWGSCFQIPLACMMNIGNKYDYPTLYFLSRDERVASIIKRVSLRRMFSIGRFELWVQWYEGKRYSRTSHDSRRGTHDFKRNIKKKTWITWTNESYLLSSVSELVQYESILTIYIDWTPPLLYSILNFQYY